MAMNCEVIELIVQTVDEISHHGYLHFKEIWDRIKEKQENNVELQADSEIINVMPKDELQTEYAHEEVGKPNLKHNDSTLNFNMCIPVLNDKGSSNPFMHGWVHFSKF